MSLERDLKEAFGRHAADATPSPAAWDQVQAAVVRVHRRRTVALGAVALAAIAAVAVAIPLATRPRAGGLTNPGGEPVPSSSPDPTAGWKTYVDPENGYQLRYPPDWRQGGFEGTVELRPEGLPGLPEGGDTFAIEMAPAGTILPFPCPDETPQGGESACETVTTAGQHDAWQMVAIEGAPRKLVVHILGSTEPLWTKFSPIADRIVSSIEPLTATAAHGTIAPGITDDDLTGALVKFLELRIEGSGAESFLSENAYNQARAGELELYETGVPGRPWVRYSIEERNDADASSAEFQVRMVWDDGPTGPDWTDETIGVGPGTTYDGRSAAAVIRFVTVTGGTDTD